MLIRDTTRCVRNRYGGDHLKQGSRSNKMASFEDSGSNHFGSWPRAVEGRTVQDPRLSCSWDLA